MLGEEGTIVIYDASQNEIGTINKETSKDSSGNYVLDISSKNNNQLSIINFLNILHLQNAYTQNIFFI